MSSRPELTSSHGESEVEWYAEEKESNSNNFLTADDDDDDDITGNENNE